jgi:hypothetical protein
MMVRPAVVFVFAMLDTLNLIVLKCVLVVQWIHAVTMDTASMVRMEMGHVRARMDTLDWIALMSVQVVH